MKRIARSGLEVTWAVLRRLPFFPFTLLSALLHVALAAWETGKGRTVARVGQATGETETLPCATLLWLDAIVADLPVGPFDVCLRLPRAAGDANLHDVLSVLLTSPRLRSIGLYWDDAVFSDDQPLWRTGRKASAAVSDAARLEAPSIERLERFFRSEHERLELPGAARREAQTFLKRRAGGGFIVALNLPSTQRSLTASVVASVPDVGFLDLGPGGATPSPANVTELSRCGLTLHERMAIVEAADVYVGRFDELGCAALASGRPAVVVGAGADSDVDPLTTVDRAAPAVWFPSAKEPAVATSVIEFLRRRRETAANDLRRVEPGVGSR